MKMRLRFAEKSSGLLLAACAALTAAEMRAQTSQGTVEVRGLIGSASYSALGGAATPLQARASVPIGAVIKTPSGSAVDLSFSHHAGTVRLLQNSTLSLDRFSVAGSTVGTVVDVQLDLREGSMLGLEKKLPNSSKYQIKVAHGIADLGGAKYRIDAQGHLVVLEGAGLFIFVAPRGDPAPFELKAPPPVYFSPPEGVRAAPAELISEVVLQTKGKLHR